MADMPVGVGAKIGFGLVAAGSVPIQPPRHAVGAYEHNIKVAEVLIVSDNEINDLYDKSVFYEIVPLPA